MRVALPAGVARKRQYEFECDFRIGRHPRCEVQVLHDHDVSPFHLRVTRIGDSWWVVDLNSTEVTFHHGERVTHLPITEPTPIRIGRRGPVLILSPVSDHVTEGTPSWFSALGSRIADWPAHAWMWLKQHARDVAHDLRGLPIGTKPRTPYELAQARRRKWFVSSLALLALLLMGAGVMTLVQRARLAAQEREIAQYRANARELFYNLKEVDVNLMGLTAALEEVTDPNALHPIKQARRQRRDNLQRYENYVASLGLYDNMAPDERIIHQVVSRFGEFSLDMPPAFADSVRRYIRMWKVGDTYRRAMERARTSGLIDQITKTLIEHDLPPEFFYLALQESHLDPTSSGPPTRFGHAKGLWQFMPATAKRYNLQTGPLSGEGRYDPQDERFDVTKSTRAAARHLRTLFTRYDQASGLLVMASYNWGEQNILRYTNQMANNPRDRNFWKLLEMHGRQVPRETRRYVFRIVAAAVIGEDPRMFGFNFDNPLQEANARYQTTAVAVPGPEPAERPMTQ